MNKRAFTLIELLVVVLIIGILAAIALPQYQKTVMKSRFAQLKIIAESIAKAQEVYYLANNAYADEFDKLDIGMPAGKIDTEWSNTPHRIEYSSGLRCYILTTGVVACRYKDAAYTVFLNHHDTYPGVRRCTAYETTDTDSFNSHLCANETGNTPHIVAADTYIWYHYQ